MDSKMEYRVHPGTGDRISVIGLGCAQMAMAGEKGGAEMLEYAYTHGINYYDLAIGEPESFVPYRKALKDVRKDVMYQVHFGAEYTSGKYNRSSDLDKVKRSIDWELNALGTDYIDYAFCHCVDSDSEWRGFFEGGVWDYILELKHQGVVRHTGLSSHTPTLVHEALDMIDAHPGDDGLDMLMFSLNPGYDYTLGQYAYGDTQERLNVYQRCVQQNIGISVMKTFSGGQLLDPALSPFSQALTRPQCIQYALDTPGVLTVLPGVRSIDDVKELLKYLDATEEERDYSILNSIAKRDSSDVCMYCNHCRPCPQGINVGLVNKYYDLAKVGDKLAAQHYRDLEKNASDCVQCGLCNTRCPFHVVQSERMLKIREFFEA